MMKSVFSIAALLALVSADAGFVSLPVTKQKFNGTESKNAVKNAKVNYVPDALKNQVFSYLATFELGSGQQQSALIDTGSSDLWVYSSGSGASGGFDPSSSTYVNNGFEIEYVDGTTATGNYYKDKLTWGSAEVTAQFAVDTSYQGGSNYGVFGISYAVGEASNDGEYANYPIALKQQGKIESTAYSLYLDDVNADSGVLLFGGVDKSRYTGELKEIPITSSSAFYVDFEVANYKLNGVLDSGTSLTYLPDDIVAEIAQSYGATYNQEAGGYQISGTPPSKGLTYSFSGLEVTVPSSELWLDVDGTGQGTFLTIFPYSQTQDIVILGDTFLRSAYVVYDIDSQKIAIAQANFNPSSPSYEAITSSGIPGTS